MIRSQWKGFTIHHSLTKDSGTVSWNAIRHYHMNTKGWRDIGYHFGIEQVGRLDSEAFEIFVGRPLTMNGAHARGLNSKQIGVCMVGNYDSVAPRKEMLIKLVRYLLVPLTLA